MDNITQFRTYIGYYQKLTNPGYAVLVTGEWGSGKTYQIKNILREDEMYYVSLFDVTSVEDIYASVFYKMSPLKAFTKSAAGSLGETSLGTDAMTLGLGGIFGKIANVVIKEDIKNDRIIVFDDIERCSIHISKILGVINKYVEHHGCKVIAIAHDEKIKQSFNDSKEKVIGQTLKIEPNINDIFNFFIANDYKDEIPENIREIILNTFIASNCGSMRILKHSINDVIRLLKCIKEEHIKNNIAMQDIFTFFIALSIAYRYGKLKESDITYRSENAIKYYVSKEFNKEKSQPPVTVELNEFYRSKGINVDLSSHVLSDETILNCLVKGYYDQNKIRLDIESNRHLNNENMEPWLILMNFDRLTKEEVEAAILDVDNQLKSLLIHDSGKILHIFNLKLLMSEIKYHSFTYEDIFNQLREYLKKLSSNKLVELPNPNSRFSLFSDSSHGHGYWVKDDYREISEKMFNLIEYFRTISLHQKYPSYKKEILESLVNTPTNFKKIISANYSGEGKFAFLDVMKCIKPIDFVEKWLQCPVNDWQTIKEGLRGRYTAGMLRNQLSGEAVWIHRVNLILQNRATKEKNFDRLRIERLICNID
ncbi:TPA: P-loop NTPase fold protein [Yersinia enterocolitica]|uniref:P-loop NTPase fold protein n=1 Tax=Yersinia enterocolitica TaxID=630 RepID=UPI002AC6064F|nr:hypothetical protein [Yersinia enterocolitica]